MTIRGRSLAFVAILLGIACSGPPSPTLKSADPAPAPPAPPVPREPTSLALELAPADATFWGTCEGRLAERRLCSSASITRFLQGVPLSVVVRLRNTGDAPTEIAVRPGGLDYDLEIAGPDGETRPLTRYGEKRLGDRAKATPTIRTLAPSETVETRILASRIVDITEPGVYQLTVVRRGAGRDTRSQVLQFDVMSY